MIGQRKKERWNKTKPCNLGFVCELGFGGKGKGKKGLRRGKPLFGSFKKIGKGFGGF